MNKTINDLLKNTTHIYCIMQYVFIAAFTTVFFLKNPLPMIYYIVILLMNTFLFFVYKGFLKSIRLYFDLYRIGIVIFGCSIPVYFSKYIRENTGKELSRNLIISTVLLFLIIIVSLLFFENKKKLEKIKEIGFMEAITGREQPGKYDITICKDKETGKPVILQTTQRYLHMLIIGATGTGKTSKCFIPQIKQDMENPNPVGIIVMEPKGDLAKKVYAMGKKYKKDIILFDPTADNCPTFNPLAGKEEFVTETVTTVLQRLAPGSIQYFRDLGEVLIKNTLIVLKRVEKAFTNPNTGESTKPATLLGFSDIINNTQGRGKEIVNLFATLPGLNDDEKVQNADTANWFLTDYYADNSKTYKDSSAVRNQIYKLTNNKYLRRIFNPENGKSDINFNEIFKNGGKIAISTDIGKMGELGSYLGLFMIYNIQSEILKREGYENTRIPCFLYIDEFQIYSTPEFADVLQLARSFRTGIIVATQSRKQIAMGAGKDGESFLESVSANCRNIILFPALSPDDAYYYERAFGKKVVIEQRKTESRQKFDVTYGFRQMNYPTESIQESEKMESLRDATSLTYKDFNEITYRIMKENTLQKPGDGIVDFIPIELNNSLDNIVYEYDRTQAENAIKSAERDMLERNKIYETYWNGTTQYAQPQYNQNSNPIPEEPGNIAGSTGGKLGGNNTPNSTPNKVTIEF